MRTSRFLVAAAPLLLVAMSPVVSFAEWPTTPATSVQVCADAANQRMSHIVDDGSGGAWIAWLDARNGGPSGNFDVYAHHILPSGVADPAIPVDGLLVCGASGPQWEIDIVSDGAGGAIIGWTDSRNDPSDQDRDIYAQHVLSSGVVDPAWPQDGTLICGAADSQRDLHMASDGAGGAILTWADLRAAGDDDDIYAHRLLTSGIVDPAWPADGLAVCTAPLAKQRPRLVSDGAGGAFVVWQDRRSNGFATSDDIYAQHVLAAGAVAPGWPVDGLGVCTATGDQVTPAITTDAAGGAIVAWADLRFDLAPDIYASRILSTGAAAPGWFGEGRPICVHDGSQTNPSIVSDGAGGAFVTWEDSRSSPYDIYAQHALPNGQLNAAFPDAGLAVCTSSNQQFGPRLASDGAGGTLIAWNDFRNGSSNPDLYVGRVLPTGTVDVVWTQGRGVATSSDYQTEFAMTGDGRGGVILAWTDQTIVGSAGDIRAQRIFRDGLLGAPEPVLVSVTDVPNDQGGMVTVTWNAGYPEFDPYNLVTNYRIYRKESGPLDPWELCGFVVATGLATYARDVPTLVDGSPFAFKVEARGGSQRWESMTMNGTSIDDTPTTGIGGENVLELALELRSNPVRGSRPQVSLALPASAPARLELLDISGRRIASRDVGQLGAGRHRVDLSPGHRLAPGIYWLRLIQGGEQRGTRFALID